MLFLVTILLLMASLMTDSLAVPLGLASTDSDVKRSDDPSPLEAIVAQQTQLIQQQGAELQALKADLAAFKTEVAGSQQLIAFMVSVPNSHDVAHHPRVQFGTPDLNVGGGFHTNTDSFVVPVSGLYVFFLKVSAAAGSQAGYGIFTLKKDGTVIAETETNDDDNVDRSSVQVIVQLTEGQSVWAELTSGGATSVSGGGVHTTLGGFLLRAGDWS